MSPLQQGSRDTRCLLESNEGEKRLTKIPTWIPTWIRLGSPGSSIYSFRIAILAVSGPVLIYANRPFFSLGIK